MIAHVAAEGENSGRVVLRLGSSERLSDVALEAAICVARAFQSGVESLFVEDSQLFDLAGFSFAREIGLSGRRSRALSEVEMQRDLEGVAAQFHRKVRDLARAFEVPLRTRVVRDDPVHALAAACAESGPWNVVTLAEPFTGGQMAGIGDLFRSVQGTTGIVVAGPNACRTTGPVVAVVEDTERAVPMLRTAERIASATGAEAGLLIVEDGSERLAFLEGQVQLALEGNGAHRLDAADMAVNDAVSVANMLRRYGAGFMIVQFGGRLVCDMDALSGLTGTLEGPVLLVR